MMWETKLPKDNTTIEKWVEALKEKSTPDGHYVNEIIKVQPGEIREVVRRGYQRCLLGNYYMFSYYVGEEPEIIKAWRSGFPLAYTEMVKIKFKPPSIVVEVSGQVSKRYDEFSYVKVYVCLTEND